jgi:nitroreductase
MVLPGILFQPEASVKAWDVNESDFPTNSSSQERLTHLLNYAILAPSSHNSQPWMFKVSENEIMVFADKSRWLKVADADRREQYISIGCALENLVIAAEHFGYNCSVSYFPGPEDLVASVTLHAGTAPRDSRLFHAINSRQTNRNPYRPLSINDADLKAIYSLSSDPEVRIFLTKDSVVKKGFLDLVVQSNAVQYSDVNYKSELGRWLGQGVMGPTGIRAKMAQLAVIFLDVGPEQTRKDAELINSTPYLGFISTANDDRISSIRAGRALQRFWLAATALGISLHPMSQALEVPETKANLTALLSTGSGDMSQVQQAFRLGYAEPVMERSTRRPLEDVLIKE